MEIDGLLNRYSLQIACTISARNSSRQDLIKGYQKRVPSDRRPGFKQQQTSNMYSYSKNFNVEWYV